MRRGFFETACTKLRFPLALVLAALCVAPCTVHAETFRFTGTLPEKLEIPGCQATLPDGVLPVIGVGGGSAILLVAPLPPGIDALSAAAPVAGAPVAGTIGDAALAAESVPAARAYVPVVSSHPDIGLHQVRDFGGYSVCYREAYEQPEWAAYTLTPEKLKKAANRGNNFREDPEITTGSATLQDYRASGYDRGHLAPAADMAYSAEAMSNSFYLSNMSPQEPSFNRGIWGSAEAEVRNIAAKYDVTYVVTGPVLDAPPEDLPSIGLNKVSVPRAYYKVALCCTVLGGNEFEVTPYAFIIPNEKTSAELGTFEVSIDEVEERTGLDLFYQFDDEIESMFESSKGGFLAR